MAKVVRREGESLDNMLVRFRIKVANEKIIDSIRRKSEFVSKGEKRRAAEKEARDKIRKYGQQQNF